MVGVGVGCKMLLTYLVCNDDLGHCQMGVHVYQGLIHMWLGWGCWVGRAADVLRV